MRGAARVWAEVRAREGVPGSRPVVAASRRRRGMLAAAVVTALLAACAEAAPAPTESVRDSAGVRIVEYPGPPEASASLRLADEPIYRHGGRPGDREFARVQIGALRTDGRAVVVDVGSGPGAGQEVVEVAADGSEVTVLARGGQGPEEVRSVRSVHPLRGDSLLLEDDGNAKLMVLAGSRFARNVSLQGRPELGQALRVHDVSDDGRLLMTTSSFRSDFTVEWLPGSMVVVDPTTLAADTVATFDLAHRRPADGRMNPFVPFGVATASGGRFAYIRTDRPELTWRAPDGAIEQILRWNPVGTPVTDEFMDAYRESLRTDLARVNPDMGGAELDAFLEEQMARIDVPPGSVLPVVRSMLGDADGRLWFPEFLPASGFENYPTYYDVVGPDGLWLGTVRMPPRFRLLDVRGGRVLGVQLDELDVEHVVVYELVGG